MRGSNKKGRYPDDISLIREQWQRIIEYDLRERNAQYDWEGFMENRVPWMIEEIEMLQERSRVQEDYILSLEKKVYSKR